MGIDAETLSQGAAGHLGRINLASSSHPGSEIDHHRAAIAGRYGKGKGIGRQKAPRTTVRCHLRPILARATTKHDGQAAGFGPALRKSAYATRVVHIGNTNGSDTIATHPGQQAVGRHAKCRHSQTVSAIDHVAPPFGNDQLRNSRGLVPARRCSFSVPVEPEDAMRIDAAEVGVHKMFGDFHSNQWLTAQGRHHSSPKADQTGSAETWIVV